MEWEINLGIHWVLNCYPEDIYLLLKGKSFNMRFDSKLGELAIIFSFSFVWF